MKKILFFLLIAALPVRAQLEFVSLFETNQMATNQVIDLTTNFPAKWFVESTRVDFQFNYQIVGPLGGTNVTANTIAFVMRKSMDGTNWLALATYLLPVTTNGTTTVYPTNATIGTYNFVNCSYITNGASTILDTNTTALSFTNVGVFATYKLQYYP